jgi:hypothetical protein
MLQKALAFLLLQSKIRITMQMNFLVLSLVSLFPLALKIVWYHPSVFGSALDTSQANEGPYKTSNKFLMLVSGVVLSYMLSVFLSLNVIHQYALNSIVMGPDLQDPNSEASIWLKASLAKYGHNYRTFGHGAFHGFLAALFFALPVVALGVTQQHKNFKYIAIQLGYWILSLTLMGGVICQFA